MLNPDFFRRNFLYLDRNFPSIASKLASNKLQKEKNTSQYQLFASKSGYPAVSTTLEGKEVALTSKVDPISSAGKTVGKIYSEKMDTFIIFGLGLGYHAECLLEKLKASQKLILIEPEWELFLFQLQAVDLRDIFNSKKFFLLVEENFSFLMDHLRFLFWELHVQEPCLFVQPPYETLYKDYSDRLRESLEEEKKGLREGKRQFIEGTKAIKENYFVNGQMKGVEDFFNRIEEKGEHYTDIELAYLFSKELLVSRSYSEGYIK